MRLWPSPAIGSLSIWHHSTLDAVVDSVMDPCRCAVKHWGRRERGERPAVRQAAVDRLGRFSGDQPPKLFSHDTSRIR